MTPPKKPPFEKHFVPLEPLNESERLALAEVAIVALKRRLDAIERGRQREEA